MNTKELTTLKGPHTKGKWIKDYPVISWQEFIKRGRIVKRYVDWRKLETDGYVWVTLPIVELDTETKYRVYIDKEYIAYMQSTQLYKSILACKKLMTVLTTYLAYTRKLRDDKAKDVYDALEAIERVLVTLETHKKIGK